MDKGIEVSGGLGEGPKGKGYLKETIHGMLRRCEGWDYSLPCMYMITVVLANRRSRALGEVRGSVIGGSSVIGDNIADNRTPLISPQLARCELTALGKAVEECWEAIPQFYPQVQIIRKQVMPDHFHGILWVKDPLGCHLGQVVKVEPAAETSDVALPLSCSHTLYGSPLPLLTKSQLLSLCPSPLRTHPPQASWAPANLQA